MTTLIHERVALCRSGDNPTMIRRVRSGWVVLGDVQFLPGYSLLLPDPVVPDLNHLKGDRRAAYLEDMAALGDALLSVTDAERVNYEILGNSEAALHAHLFPRYGWEEADLRSKPAWFYDWEGAVRFDAVRDRDLMVRIGEQLDGSGLVIEHRTD